MAWKISDRGSVLLICRGHMKVPDGTFQIFSCASAKAERGLSSLYGMFLYVELGDPPAEISQVHTIMLHLY